MRGRLIWESAADASFTIAEDKDGEPLGRGTMLLGETFPSWPTRPQYMSLRSRFSGFLGRRQKERLHLHGHDVDLRRNPACQAAAVR